MDKESSQVMMALLDIKVFFHQLLERSAVELEPVLRLHAVVECLKVQRWVAFESQEQMVGLARL